MYKPETGTCIAFEALDRELARNIVLGLSQDESESCTGSYSQRSAVRSSYRYAPLIGDTGLYFGNRKLEGGCPIC